MDFELPEELKLLRDLVRSFVKKELSPLEDRVEEADDIPPDTLCRIRIEAHDLGLLGYNTQGWLDPRIMFLIDGQRPETRERFDMPISGEEEIQIVMGIPMSGG